MSKILKKLNNLSIQLILIFAIALFLGPYIAPTVKSVAYSISLTINSMLLFLLPFIIFSCLFHSLVANRGHAIRFVAILLVVVCVSNFVSILAAYFLGTAGLSQISGYLQMSGGAENAVSAGLEPLWKLNIPKLIPNEIALLAGLIVGIFFSLFRVKGVIKFGEKANHFVTVFLRKLFVPVLPLFALGFIVKMEHDGILMQVIGKYAPIVLLIVAANIIYLGLMFAIAAKFNPRKFWFYIKNSLPAGILGFSTMSSIATMPVTLSAAEKNTGNEEVARAVIPATVNIHLLGDSISIPILAMAVALTFNQPLPGFAQYFMFLQFFMIAKFAAPGIPCGTIIVMIPILEKYMGFTPEMSAFIAAIYILFDTIITSANVLGNSALAVMLTRILGWFSRKKADATHEQPATLQI